MKKSEILIVGAGINGLVAANYLNKSGVNVTLIDQSKRVGGACISEVAQINGENFNYAIGASVFIMGGDDMITIKPVKGIKTFGSKEIHCFQPVLAWG